MLFPRPRSRAPRRRFAAPFRIYFVRPRLEGLEDRCTPSVSPLAVAQQFVPGTSSLAEVSFQLDQAGNPWEYNPTLGTTGANANLAQLSTGKTGTWSSLAAAVGADGNPALFAVNKADGSLWEHSLIFGDKTSSGAAATEGATDLNWRKLSGGDFLEISATTAASSGASGDTAVVYGIVAGGTLWEHSINFGDHNAQGAVAEASPDLNWREISSNSFTHIAAAQVAFPPSAAAPGGFAALLLADPIVFGISANGNLWEHNANLNAGHTGAASEGTTDANWSTISTGAFTALAAVMDFSVTAGTGGAAATLGPGHPVVYAVASGSGNVWEHNTDMSSGAAPEGMTDANWGQLTTGAFSQVSATVQVEPASGVSPLTVKPVLYGVMQGSGNLWEHNALLNSSAGEFAIDANWAELSSGEVGAFVAALHTITNGAEPAVFALPADFNLWEHYLSSTPVGSEATTDANWSMLSTGLGFGAAPAQPLIPAGASTLLTLNLNPLNINLLGLQVQTNQIQIAISALPGQGELLGNVLTDAANLLNLQGVNNALNNVLGSVVSLLNSTSLNVAGVNTTTGSLIDETPAVTPVLDLFVAPVHLNLLGALVDTSPIHLTITAQSGQGLVLGNVIKDLANLFNPPLPSQLSLDTINNSLTQLLGELNQQIPNIGSAPTTNSTTTLGTDQIVSLNVPPINLNLLGLVLQTTQIQVNANAITGNGDLLGNVLTTLLNTLGATPQNLTTLSNNLNALLAKVVGVLNASSLILPSGAISSLSQTLQTLALPNLVNSTGTASAPILNLAIASTNGTTPPVNVNLLGLQVTTSNIQAQLLAQTGDGQVLGNLLYNVANLLNPGGTLNLLALLNALAL